MPYNALIFCIYAQRAVKMWENKAVTDLATEVYMDTEVFTEIVDGIAFSGSQCHLDSSFVKDSEKMAKTDITDLLSEYTSKYYDFADNYKVHVSENLPHGLSTLRDSLIMQDKIISEAID